MDLKRPDIKLSEEISSVVSFFKRVKNECNQNREKLTLYDRKTSDFNHSLELDNLNYSERAKLATKQRDNLIERRKCKDIIYEYQPLADLLTSKEGIRFLNLLNEALGKTRKQEQLHKDRFYRKRVPDKE